MYEKIIIAEDLGSINESVLQLGKKLQITEIHQVQYCEEAYMKIKKAHQENVPYQLLITDLSFKPDYREQYIKSGKEIIKRLKAEHPELKIIAYSIEDRKASIEQLLKLGVEAYVCKDRNGLVELEAAIISTFKNESYISPQIEKILDRTTDFEIEDYDIFLLNNLAEGFSQEAISKQLKSKNIAPNSLSSIEKRVSKLKIHLGAKNTYQLIALSKDIGLI
ncbi:response regulator [Mesonia sp.]|uniref:response regulator n=1 Tax=Mesonia sp. TaxID=1960830 RepID=UPI0017700D2B|nr:response regulator [Mesonia sp.]HIB38439.1 response regulator transcription factor [Mesonia sp.]HIO26807.1 response regulator transcription factor [Flavobacteriaceae bacterium]